MDNWKRVDDYTPQGVMLLLGYPDSTVIVGNLYEGEWYSARGNVITAPTAWRTFPTYDPPKILSRRYLVNTTIGNAMVKVAQTTPSLRGIDLRHIEGARGFKRWVDKEWQEIII